MRVASLSWLSIVTTVRTNGTIASMKQERDSRKAHGGYLRPFSLLPVILGGGRPSIGEWQWSCL
jgi:hypothetical protein